MRRPAAEQTQLMPTPITSTPFFKRKINVASSSEAFCAGGYHIRVHQLCWLGHHLWLRLTFSGFASTFSLTWLCPGMGTMQNLRMHAHLQPLPHVYLSTRP